jgi:hypothetical protein
VTQHVGAAYLAFVFRFLKLAFKKLCTALLKTHTHTHTDPKENGGFVESVDKHYDAVGA